MLIPLSTEAHTKRPPSSFTIPPLSVQYHSFKAYKNDKIHLEYGNHLGGHFHEAALEMAPKQVENPRLRQYKRLIIEASKKGPNQKKEKNFSKNYAI